MDAVGARKYLAHTLKDSIDLVRGRIARAYTRIVLPENAERLLPLLEDRSQIVRYQIGLGLRDRGLDDSLARTFVVERLLDDESREGYTYGILLPLARKIEDGSTRRDLYRGLIDSDEPEVRANAVDLAIVWNDEGILKEVVERVSDEDSSLVLSRIYAAEAMLE